MDGADSNTLKYFQRLERILEDVKILNSKYTSVETKRLYDIFAEYGGPIHVVLELQLKNHVDPNENKVFQALRDILTARLMHLCCEIESLPSVDCSVIMHQDVKLQWEHLLNVAPHELRRDLVEHFEDLINSFKSIPSSLEGLEMTLKQVCSSMDYKLPNQKCNNEESGQDTMDEILRPVDNTVPQSGNVVTQPLLRSTSIPSHGNENYYHHNFKSPLHHIDFIPTIKNIVRNSVPVTEKKMEQPGNDPRIGNPKSNSITPSDSSKHDDSWQNDILRGRLDRHSNASVHSCTDSTVGTCEGAGNHCLSVGLSMQQLSDPAWLPKSDIPQWPFKSKECDIVKQNKCNKLECSTTQGPNERNWWICKHQTNTPYTTEGTLDQNNGFIYIHTPEDQKHNMLQHTKEINLVTGRNDDVASYSYYSNSDAPLSSADFLSNVDFCHGYDTLHIYDSTYHAKDNLLELHGYGSDPGREIRNYHMHELPHTYPQKQEEEYGNINDCDPPKKRCYSLMDNLSTSGSMNDGNIDIMTDVRKPSGANSKRWLGKNELPRPFRSKLCDFYLKTGVCAKTVCNYAHTSQEMADWLEFFQTMFRCNNKNCLGRDVGCTYSHTPEEQLINRHIYDVQVNNAKTISHSSFSADHSSLAPHSVNQYNWMAREMDLLNTRVAQLPSFNHM